MDLRLNLISLTGVYIFCLLAWLVSTDRKKIPYDTIKWGLGIQFFLSFIFMLFPSFLSFISKLAQFFSYIYILPLAVNEREIYPEFLNYIIKDSIILRTFIIGIFIGTVCYLLIRTKFFQRVIVFISNFSRSIFIISGEEFITGIFSIILSFESIFSFPNIKVIDLSQIFTVVTILLSTSSSFLIYYYTENLSTSIQNVRGHLFLGSILSMFSAIVISKIMIPSETLVEHPKNKSGIHFFSNLRDGVNHVSKFTIGMILGGLFVVCIINFLDGSIQLLANIGEGKVISGDGIMTVILKVMKSGISEIFSRINPRNILAILLFPFCLFTGISVDILELWKTSLYLSQSLLGMSPKLSLFIPILKENSSERVVLYSLYILGGAFSFASWGMVLGGFFSILPDRADDIQKIALRSLLSCLLTQMITLSMIGIFEFGTFKL